MRRLRRIDDLTAAMVEEYGGVAQFAGPIVQSGVNAFLDPRIISDDGLQFIARDFKEFIPHLGDEACPDTPQLSATERKN